MRKILSYLAIGFVVVCGCVPAKESVPRPAARSVGPQPPVGARFYFVQMTDTHWGARDGVAMTRSAVDLINRLPVKVEFVAVTGDLFADSIRREQVVQEGKAALRGLNVPVYCSPGNHDLLQDDFQGTREIFEKHFGPIEQKVMVKGVACLFLCTEMPANEKRSAWQVERTILEKLIGNSQDPVLVFMHRPPLRDGLANEADSSAWNEVTDSRWTLLFEKHPGVKGVFAGHFHRDEMIWVGGAPVYVAPALARFWDRQPALRLYEYRDGRINYWTLYPERPPRK